MSTEMMALPAASISRIDDYMSAAQIRAQVNLIQEVMQEVMKEGTHFGKVPGCGDKPTLLKPGAEKLMATFRLSVDPEVEDMSGPDEVRYRIRARLSSASGNCVGIGVGEASSGEDKYKWRKAVCKQEFDETPEDRRRKKWIAPYQKTPYQALQVRTNPADVANTVLKMAKKRAMVDAVLTATGASDIFVQDIEDVPEELHGSLTGEDQAPPSPSVAQPQSKSGAAEKPPIDGSAQRTGEHKPMTDGMKKMIRVKLEAAALTETDLTAKFGAGLDELDAGRVNEVLEWAKSPNV